MSTPPFLDLPAGTRAHRMATERGPLAVLDTPPTGGDPRRSTALLVPGFTGSKEDFIGIIADLAAQGRRVVAIDQRGQYESTGPDTESAYHLDELVGDLLALIGALDEGPVHLLGHSFGGLVARAAALASPGAVRSLTLLGSGPAAVPGAAADRARLMVQALGSYDLLSLWEAMQAVNAAAGGKPPAEPPIAEFLRRRFLSNSPACLQAMAQRLLDEPDRVAELAGLALPVLVAYGVDDDAWPPQLQAEMAGRLGARRVAIPGAGHSPAAEQPEVTATVLAGFWAEVERG